MLLVPAACALFPTAYPDSQPLCCLLTGPPSTEPWAPQGSSSCLTILVPFSLVSLGSAPFNGFWRQGRDHYPLPSPGWT